MQRGRSWIAAAAGLVGIVLTGLPRLALPADAGQPAAPRARPLQATTGGQLQSLDEVIARWGRLDTEQRARVIEQVIAAGQLETAERLIADYGARTRLQQVTGRFLLGQLRAAQGRTDEAIAIFRELLADDPQLARVRLQLALALYQRQDDENARHQFELVMGSATNTELSNTVSRFIDSINERKRLTFSTYASVLPSTNFNQGASARTVTLNGLDFRIDPHAQSQRGVGFASGLSAAYRAPVAERLDLVIGGGAHTRQFRNTTFDDAIVLGEIGPRWRLEQGTIGLYGTASRRWLGGDQWWGGQSFAMSYGARLHGRVRVARTSIVDGTVACAEKRYDTQAWQDGWNCAVAASVDHFLDGHTFVRVLGGAEREITARPWLNYRAGSVGIGAYREIAHGVSLYGQVQYAHRVYDADFPAANVARTDDRIDATLQVTKRNWLVLGLAPMLQYSYTRNFSTIALFDYDAHGLNLTLTRTF